jgi:hypothetical protein
MLADSYEGTHGSRTFTVAGKRVGISELDEEISVLDELVDEVVVTGRVWEEGFSLRQS